MRAGTVQKRSAFTLVELLVVIAIIAILMALTIGVLSKVWQNVDETKTTTEVSKMAEAINQFKGQFGRYPPSRIILAEQGATYANIINGTIPPPAGSGFTPQQWASLGAYSSEYLTSLFPGINLNAGHDWNGNGAIDAVNTYVVLEGEQCLVYFLGGLRYGGAAPQGFNTDKTNPTALTSSARLGPFYPFDESRIDTVRPFGFFSAGYNGPFYTYKDYYGTAYAFFLSRYVGTNNYPNLYVPNNPLVDVPNDCAQLTNPSGTVGFVPYFIGTIPPGPATLANWGSAANFQFHKADTFQIVSAGRDKLFGTGGQFNVNDPENSPFIPTAVVPGVTSDMIKANFDNITNFTSGRLVPQ